MGLEIKKEKRKWFHPASRMVSKIFHPSPPASYLFCSRWRGMRYSCAFLLFHPCAFCVTKKIRVHRGKSWIVLSHLILSLHLSSPLSGGVQQKVRAGKGEREKERLFRWWMRKKGGKKTLKKANEPQMPRWRITVFRENSEFFLPLLPLGVPNWASNFAYPYNYIYT